MNEDYCEFLSPKLDERDAMSQFYEWNIDPIWKAIFDEGFTLLAIF